MFLAERYCPVCQQYQQCKFPCTEHDPHPCPKAELCDLGWDMHRLWNRRASGVTAR